MKFQLIKNQLHHKYLQINSNPEYPVPVKESMFSGKSVGAAQ